MTLSAQAHPTNPKQVIVRTTYGPVTNEVIEEAGHVRGFHDQLGRLLDDIEGYSEPKGDA